MLSKCANPACAMPFQYLREGQLYRFEMQEPFSGFDAPSASKRAPGKLEHFWLCGRCAAYLTLRLGHACQVEVVPRKDSRRAVAS